jgi:DNA-binding MarR family transcriptional regulator
MQPTFNIENTLGYWINRCAILLKNELTHRFKQAGHDVTPEEWVILNRLWEQDGLSQNELADRTIKDKTTVTRFLNNMEAKGLVIRKPNKEDGRFKKIHLTSTAQKLRPVLIKIAQGMLTEVSSNLSEANLHEVLTLLEKIEKNLLAIESRTR